MVVERRVDDVAALLITALIRDMRGAQESILAPLSAEHLDPDVPYEIVDRVSRAFSRFPYPESFFVWIPRDPRSSAVLFNRSDRMPRWEKSGASQTTFPVTIVRDSPVAAHLGRSAGKYAVPRTELASFESTFEGIP
jgi:hypothetical protein